MNVSAEYPVSKHIIQDLDELNLMEVEAVVQQNFPSKAYSGLPDGYLALAEERILDPLSKPNCFLS